MASYGKVGVNVGSVGRWTRFVLGVVMILIVATDFYPVTHTHDMASYAMMVLSFVAIVGVYTLGHVLIGDKLSGKSAWWGTMIFVVPAMFLLIAPRIRSAPPSRALVQSTGAESSVPDSAFVVYRHLLLLSVASQIRWLRGRYDPQFHLQEGLRIVLRTSAAARHGGKVHSREVRQKAKLRWLSHRSSRSVSAHFSMG